MSEVKRYTAAGEGVVRTDPNGDLVFFDDYAALHYERIHDLNQIGGLQEENARLRAEVERLTWLQVETLNERNKDETEVERLDTLCKQLSKQHSDISCENIMLRKAGDAMASSIQFNEEMAQDYNGPTIVHQCVQRWNAAKEGKPTK